MSSSPERQASWPNPHSVRGTAAAYLPRFRASALFGRRLTLGNMRENGVDRLDVLCWICHHCAVLDVDGFDDDVPVQSFRPAHGLNRLRHRRCRRSAEVDRHAEAGDSCGLGLAAVNWQRRLPRTIGYTKPRRGTITTLHEARAYMLAIKNSHARRKYWRQAATLLMQAAEGGDLEALAAQIELALMMDGALELRQR